MGIGKNETESTKKCIQFEEVSFNHGKIKEISLGGYHSVILTEDTRELWACGE